MQLEKLKESLPKDLLEWLSHPALTWGLAFGLCAVGIAGLIAVPREQALWSSVVPSDRTGGPRMRFAYPEGAVRYLRESPYEGRLLNPFNQGEFLYWVLYPKFRVSSDGRFEEVYDREQFRSVYDFYHQHAPHHPERVINFANRSGADIVLFRSIWKNFPVLARDPGWQTIYDDGVFALVGRKSVLDVLGIHKASPDVTSAKASTIREFFFDPSGRRDRFRNYP